MSRCYQMLAGGILVLAAVLTGCRPEPAATGQFSQIHVVSQPPGAMLICGDLPAARTPTTLQVPPGRHLITARLSGYEEMRATVVARPGERLPLEMKLEPLRGLVLLQSRPAGADVEMENVHYGKTPVFLPNLSLGSHRIKFSAPGFFSKVLEVELQDRTPVRVMAQLDSDAARLLVDSKPAGARVLLNNAMIGQTPHRHPRLGPGAHVLEVVKEGFSPYREEFTVSPGEERRVNVTLLPLPGRLEVTTVPSGARVYVAGQYRGEAPHARDDLPAGSYVISAELPGYALGVVTAQVAQGAAAVVELRLARTSGTLLVSTDPPGVTILLDGVKKGVTAARPGEQISEQLMLEMVPEGERMIQFTRQGYFEATQTRNVTPGQTVIIHQKLTLRPVAFVPNVLIRTGTGPAFTFRGVLRERYANGDVMVELEPGVFRTFRAAEILEMETINPR